MAKEIIKEGIDIGDLVSVGGEVYVVSRKRTKDCRDCCDLWNGKEKRCRGLCYRYDDDGIVFRYLGDELTLPKNTRVVVTGMWDKVAERLEDAKKKTERMRAKRNYIKKNIG